MIKPALIITCFFVVVAFAFVYSGYINVAATEKHDPVSSWILETARNKSIEARTSTIEVPDLEDKSLQLAGINDFDSMCAGCHTAPGRKPSPLAIGLNPPAPDLGKAALKESPEKLFWITKNGIRMTGMPAWGITHDDTDIWPVVAFLQVLPDLDDHSYRDMLNKAAGHGHHAH